MLKTKIEPSMPINYNYEMKKNATKAANPT